MEWFLSLSPILQVLLAGILTWLYTLVGSAAVFFIKDVNNKFLAIMQGAAGAIRNIKSFRYCVDTNFMVKIWDSIFFINPKCREKYLRLSELKFRRNYMKKFRVGILTSALFLALSLIAMLVLWIGGKFFNIEYNNLILQGLVIGFISTFALFVLDNIIKKKK